MPLTITDAFLKARGRGVLPSALSSRELREAVAAGVRARAVFSARTTSVVYLEVVRAVIQDLLRTETADGRSFGQAEARLKLKQALAALGYDSERGHFGTAADADVPPAMRGSLQDLSSDARLNLIIDTQRLRWQAAGQEQRGMQLAVLAAFPAWELVDGGALEPRTDWSRRWLAAGGVMYGAGENRLIAAKASPVWKRLGELAEFSDVVDGGLPPFAFGSKRVWQAVSARECRELGVELLDGESGQEPADSGQEQGAGKPLAVALPVPVVDVPAAISPAGKAALEKTVQAKVQGKRLTFDEILSGALARGAAARAAADAAAK